MTPNKGVLFVARFEDPTLPPPFKHRFSIEVASLPDGVEVNYKLEYLERDTIDEDEIYAEGFTTEDDYKWKGKLKVIWKELLVNFIKLSNFKEKPRHPSDISVLLPDHKEPQFPDSQDEWHYLMQELMQAIFETSGKEAPLELTFLDISNGKKVDTSAIVSFAERSLSYLRNENGQVKKVKKDWEESKKLMELVYALEYLPEKAHTTLPKKEGGYINIGEGVWYQLGVSALNPGKRKDFIALLHKAIQL